MRFPWQKDETSNRSQSVVPPLDPVAIREETAEQVRREMTVLMEQVAELAATSAREQAFAEVSRALTTNPMPAMSNPNHASPFAAYGMDRPITFSTPQAPTRKPMSLVSTDTLRGLADNYDILRACINHLKREVLSVPLEIVPRDPKDQKRRTKKRLAEARDLFTKKGAIGGFGTPRRHFESRLIEDLCVIGAGAVFHERARGGWVRQSVEIDASTIRPFIDAYGWAPSDDGPNKDHVYEQWVYGMQVANFSRADLTYDGIYSLSYSPYFKSPVEYLIDAVDTALRSNLWNKGWLTDGNSPDEAYSMPETWSAKQVMEYAEWWDSLLTSSKGGRHKTRFLPGGSQRVGARSRKDQDFTGLELQLIRRTCAIMGVQPASIAFSGEQYKVSQENSQDQTTAFGAGVILEWRKDMYDDILERHGYGEFEVQNVTARQDTAKERAETNKILIESGQRTPNECRQADGEDPYEGGDSLLVQSTLVPLTQAASTEQPDETGKNAETDKKSDPAAVGTGGSDVKDKPAAQKEDEEAEPATRLTRMQPATTGLALRLPL